MQSTFYGSPSFTCLRAEATRTPVVRPLIAAPTPVHRHINKVFEELPSAGNVQPLRSATSRPPGRLMCKRVGPLQAGEPRKIGVRGYPFAAMLDCERRMPCIRDQRACCRNLPAQICEDLPVAPAGSQNLCLWTLAEPPAKLQSFSRRRRLLENPRIGDDAYEPTQYRLGKAVCARTFRLVNEPRSVLFVELRRISPMCVDEDVDVRQYHGRNSRSSSAAMSALGLFRSMPS